VQLGDVACLSSLVVAASLSPAPARTESPALPEDARLAPPPQIDEPLEGTDDEPPRGIHLRFHLEPQRDGIRLLVLRDDDGMRLPLGFVEPSWACDSASRAHGFVAPRAIDVGCGGGQLTASVSASPAPSRSSGWPHLTVKVSNGVGFDIPVSPQDGVALDGQLVDPGAPKCRAAPHGPPVALMFSEEEVPHQGYYEEARRLRLVSPSLPLLDVTVHADAHEECVVQRDAGRTQLTLECHSPREPYLGYVELRVREGALLWTEGRQQSLTIKGGWWLPCGAPVQWPSVPLRHEEDIDGDGRPSEPQPRLYLDMMPRW